MVMSWVQKTTVFLAMGVGLAALPLLVTAQEAAENLPQDGGTMQAEETDTASQAAEPVDVIPVSEISAAEAPLETEEHGAVKLDDVVVTARKRQETIQNVPLSVTAFSAKDMEQRGYSGLDDIAAATPGFTFEGFMTGGAHGNPVIRGLAQTFTTSRIQNVSFFLDGVYLQRQSMLNLGLVDMERIEVVKGPQNALYGRNAFAGAINYVTLAPNNQVEGYLVGGLGDNERAEYRASISGPIGDNWLGKFTVGAQTYDGHTRNNHPVADADPAGPNLRGNLGGNNDVTYSASLLYEPPGSLRVRGSVYRSEIEHETAPGYSISGVNAARFGLRFDDQNDLNCNVATVRDIQPQPPRTHTGFSAWCGELPLYASDVAPRKVAGIVVDPRAIGTITETNALTLSADYDITSDLSVHYLFGFADHTSYTDGGASDEDPLAGRGINTNALLTQIDNQDPAAYTFANTASGRPNSELQTFSHELRFDWMLSDRMRTSFGAYYSTVTDEEWTTLFINDLCNADSAENIANCNKAISAPNKIADSTVVTVAPAWDQYTRQHGGKNRGEWTGFDESIAAVFSSVGYDFTDNLNGTIEARFSYEQKKIARFTDSFAVAPGEVFCYGLNCTGIPPDNPACAAEYTDPTAPVLPIASCLVSGVLVPRDEETFTEFTPRAILNWQFAENSMVYGSIAKGIKAGGFNNAVSEAELTYDQEVNWTYEIGSKNTFFKRRLTLNGALYYVDWTGLQGGVPPAVAGLSTSDIITNIGGASSAGVELETKFGITEWLTFNFGGTYNDATYADGTKYAAGRQDTGSVHCDGVTCPADGDISGNQLARTSKVQYSVGLDFDTYLNGWGIGARIDSNYQSKQFVEPLNLAWVPERQLTNASIRLVSPDFHWELVGWAKNLTDELYPANSFVIGVFNQYMVATGARRTWGMNLKYKF
jgi:iron complex outermembrane recepter protein